MGGLVDDIPIIKLLISYGANPFEKTNQLFCRACYYGDISFVKYLIDLGADCNHSEIYPTDISVPMKPICFAFEPKDNWHHPPPKLELIKILLDNGANPNEIISGTTIAYGGISDTQYKLSLLENCIFYCDAECCKLLFEYGADINSCYNIINKNYICFKAARLGAQDINILHKIIDIFMEHNLDITEVVDAMIQYK
jgi:ankyrin repeat protein